MLVVFSEEKPNVLKRVKRIEKEDKCVGILEKKRRDAEKSNQASFNE